MKKRIVITTEKHEVWVIRQIKDATDGEQENSEQIAIADFEDLLNMRPVLPADNQGTKE